MDERLAPASRLILHVVYSFSTGGLENGVANLIDRLPAHRWRHGVIALTRVSPELRERVQRSDTLFMELGKGPGHAFRLFPRLFRLFRELRPAIVHTRNLAALEALVPAAAAGVGVRVHGEHGRDVHDLDGSRRKYRLIRRIHSPFVTRYVALSRDLERYLHERVGIPPERIEQIYNGVDLERFRPASAGRGAVPGCPFRDPGHWLVGTVGRLEAVKDQVSLARAFALALKSRPDARRRLRLVIAGEGSLRPGIERILRDDGALELAWLSGERPDVPELMRGLDCFVLPSLAEGISNTILEAMASGLPVIATRVGGNPELVEDGVTGRLVPPADPAVLAREILAYYDDPEIGRRHGGAGRQLAGRRYSLEQMIKRYDELYGELLHMDDSARAAAGRSAREPVNG